MPEHVHILLLQRREDYRIAMILKAIKQPVARKALAYLRDAAPQWLERLKIERPYGRIEYRFRQQGGGYDRNIIKPKMAWAAVEYIDNNPVRRSLANCPTDWEWPSASWYAGDAYVRMAMDDRPRDPPQR